MRAGNRSRDIVGISTTNAVAKMATAASSEMSTSGRTIATMKSAMTILGCDYGGGTGASKSFTGSGVGQNLKLIILRIIKRPQDIHTPEPSSMKLP